MNKKSIIIAGFSFIVNITALCLHAQTNTILPVNATIEMLYEPVGVDVSNLNFGWNLTATDAKRRGVKQTAYQVLVASSCFGLNSNQGNCWNTGKVLSDKMGQVIYAGMPLLSGKKYWWKVKVWDEQNNVSAWSKPSTFIMGMLSSKDWQAQWITANGADKYALQYEWAKKISERKRYMLSNNPMRPVLVMQIIHPCYYDVNLQ